MFKKAFFILTVMFIYGCSVQESEENKVLDTYQQQLDVLDKAKDTEKILEGAVKQRDEEMQNRGI